MGLTLPRITCYGVSMSLYVLGYFLIFSLATAVLINHIVSREIPRILQKFAIRCSLLESVSSYLRQTVRRI